MLSWLLTIARRVKLDKLKALGRREKKHVPLPIASGASTGGGPVLVAVGGSPENIFGEREEQQRAQRALAALPDLQRRVLELHHLEGLSFEEVSWKLNVSVKRVRGECRKGNKALRRSLVGQPALKKRRTKS